jgi:hypothetical protein
MSKGFRLPEEIRFQLDSDAAAQPADPAPRSADQTLKNLRYVVASVNDEALKAWTDLWEQLRSGVTPAGAVLPDMQQGFTPPCGWSQFFETFWLMKHYLDYVHRLCEDSVLPSQGEKNLCRLTLVTMQTRRAFRRE